MSPLNSVPFFEKAWYMKKEHYSNFCTFEIASLVNVPRHYLRKYGSPHVDCTLKGQFPREQEILRA